MSEQLNFRVGQWVEVRSADEVLATLDAAGALDELPFMPEMLQYCGRRLKVGKVAHKSCDTISRTGIRKMERAVHLADARCSGADHGGCQANCLIYWKEAWLRPVDGPGDTTQDQSAGTASPGAKRLLPVIVTASRRPPAEDGTEIYSCQATKLPDAAPHTLPWRNLGQYVVDVRSGNVSVFFAARAFLVGLFNRVQYVSRRIMPQRLWFRHGLPWGFLEGSAVKTPTADSGLRPGELVRIKPKDEIVRTLNRDLLNRGMGFDAEMSRFCGRTARVARRVHRIIDEKSGRMIDMRNPCIVLEGIVCEGAYSVSCPRAIPCYWREVWLDRVPEFDRQPERV